MSGRHEPVVRNDAVRGALRERYRPADVEALADVLRGLGAFDLRPLDNGLFRAVARSATATEYARTWVRDTVHVANVAWEAGQTGLVRRTAQSLLRWFASESGRFEDCIAGRADLDDPMQRPHVRFDGATLRPAPEWWPHIQNDALGYGLWFLVRAALSGLLPLDGGGVRTLSRFAPYFASIEYWRDADSGHWEEHRKVSASSIGTVVAGLRALEGLIGARARRGEPGDLAGGVDVGELLGRGRETLARILPHETRDAERAERDRVVDGALLFLVHPLRVVDEATEQAILDGVHERLEGARGIRRYVGDSYWMAGWSDVRTEPSDVGDLERVLDARDALLEPGTEAQWCLFDPLLSTIYGWRFLRTRDEADRERQVHHLHRSLGQITGPECGLGEGLFPEAYYLPDVDEPERWEANGNTPLLWTQALVVQALLALERTAGVEG